MIVDDEDVALNELTRVLKKDGKLYLLVYATDGIRWPLIQVLRPLCEQLGQEEVERAMKAADMPANKRRTFLDDLFCPKLDFYHWARLQRMLERRGFKEIDRWGDETRLDHEHTLKDYREDLESLLTIFEAGKKPGFAKGTEADLYEQGYKATRACVDSVAWFEAEVKAGRLKEKDAMKTAIGQGHHRVIAVKG